MTDAPQLVVCTWVSGARGADAAAAALAVSVAVRERDGAGVLVLDLRPTPRSPRGTLLASGPARALESVCGEVEGLRGAARGRVCFAAPAAQSDGARETALAEAIDPGFGASLVVVVCEATSFRLLLAAGELDRRAALLRATSGAERSLLALACRELLVERVPVKVWAEPIGAIPARRALAGLEPGGESGRRAARFASRLAPARGSARLGGWSAALQAERAQALPALLGIAALVIAVAVILAALGGAATAKGRIQRATDLAALSAARSMRDDLSRLFVPPSLAGGAPNPAHLTKAEYLDRARIIGVDAAERNGVEARLVTVSFPDGGSFAPLRVRVEAAGQLEVRGAGEPENVSTRVAAKAEVTPPADPGPSPGTPTMASGGGYGGPLAYRQGKPMRPDVAAAFDRMAAAASVDGVSLTINSGYRSDAEQQELWNANPDPQMVAPPGTSLHRCGTELDLGPSAAYGWLAANAGRFGFLQRYSWEAWHYGYTEGPEPCSAEGDSGGVDPVRGGGASAAAEADGELAGGGGLPAFVPPQYRQMLIASAARHDVSAALLAAQIMAESNFNPNAVSPVGAQGIAQFMPATALAYGLDDPFDPEQAIEAQATLMGELLAQFRSIELALAAYNAGPGAVAGCTCIPPYPETQAYVVRIMALLDGAGELTVPTPVLEVRLVG